MKIATVLIKPNDATLTTRWLKCFQYWAKCASAFNHPSDIVLITDGTSEYHDAWHTVVETDPYPNEWKPVYELQQLLFADSLKAMAYRLVKEPVMIIDCDVILQARLHQWSDTAFRVGQHNSGYAPSCETVGGIEYPWLNCCVQYQGLDMFDDYARNLEQCLNDERVRSGWTLGETATSMTFANATCSKELLPVEYSWYTATGDNPRAIGLHYGCEEKDALFEIVDCNSVAKE